MKRRWPRAFWWGRAALWTLVTSLAIVQFVATTTAYPNQSPFMRRWFRHQAQEGLDRRGGVRLGYQVNVDRAVAGAVDQIAEDVRGLGPSALRATVSRVEVDQLQLQFEDPADARRPWPRELAGHATALEEVDRGHEPGRVRYRLSQGARRHIADRAAAAAYQRLSAEPIGSSPPYIGAAVRFSWSSAGKLGLPALEEGHSAANRTLAERPNGRRPRLGVHGEGRRAGATAGSSDRGTGDVARPSHRSLAGGSSSRPRSAARSRRSSPG